MKLLPFKGRQPYAAELSIEKSEGNEGLNENWIIHESITTRDEKVFQVDRDHPRLLAAESHRLALANAAIFHNVIGKMLCVESCVKAFMYLKLQTGVGGRKKRKINQVYRIIVAFPFFLLLNPIWFLFKRSTIRPPLSDRHTSWRVPRRTSKRRKSPWRESSCRRSRPSAARRLRNIARMK